MACDVGLAAHRFDLVFEGAVLMPLGRRRKRVKIAEDLVEAVARKAFEQAAHPARFALPAAPPRA